MPCARQISEHVNKNPITASKRPLHAVRKKFESPKYLSVANEALPVLPSSSSQELVCGRSADLSTVAEAAAVPPSVLPGLDNGAGSSICPSDITVASDEAGVAPLSQPLADASGASRIAPSTQVLANPSAPSGGHAVVVVPRRARALVSIANRQDALTDGSGASCLNTTGTTQIFAEKAFAEAQRVRAAASARDAMPIARFGGSYKPNAKS